MSSFMPYYLRYALSSGGCPPTHLSRSAATELPLLRVIRMSFLATEMGLLPQFYTTTNGGVIFYGVRNLIPLSYRRGAGFS